MFRINAFRFACFVCVFAAVLCDSCSLWAQAGNQGTIAVTAQDASGAVIPDANLELVEIRSNSTRSAKTASKGAYSFVNLNIGRYRLTVSREGYATKIFDAIEVQSAQTNGIVAVLPVGEVSQTVRVTADSTPVLETTSNAIGLVVDMKQIEDLPLNGRSLTSFGTLVAGYNGTYNGLPSPDQGNNIDGALSSGSRMKFGGNTSPAVSPRLESIEQMSIQTDQLDLNSGFGQATTQINYVSRRGSNRLHGRAYEDFRNSYLNANSWVNDAIGARKNKLILNDFGVSVGGPVLHDKLFFFATYAQSIQPGTTNASNSIFPTTTQQGNFTYKGTDGNSHTVNVYDLANKYQPGLGKANAQIQGQLAMVNKATSLGVVSSTGDPNLNTLTWLVPSPVTTYFPAARVDYNATQKLRLYLSFLETRSETPVSFVPNYPGSDFSNQQASSKGVNYVSSFGADYIVSPNLINQLKFGYLYNANFSQYNANLLQGMQPSVAWNFTGAVNGNMSGEVYTSPITTYYPLFSASDSATLQKAGHTISFGASWYREQDHYYNPIAGYATFSLGLANGDPAISAFTNGGAGTVPFASSAQLSEAQQLFAVLTGRVSSASGQYPYNKNTKDYTHGISRYNLDEVSSATGLFAEDSWKVSQSLTLNYGLRWDFTGDQHDLTDAYHSALPDSVYGPSGVGNLFKPGTLGGNMNPALTTQVHAYSPYHLTPQPAFGLAYNPKVHGGLLGALMGGDSTVIRAGFALRRFSEPYQFYWDNASDMSAIYYQNLFLTANSTGQPGTFVPGSLQLSATGSYPTFGTTTFGVTPAAYSATTLESTLTFKGNSTGIRGLDPNIKQPYTESWNLGVQRSLGRSRVLEVRYNGNRSVHQWLALNPNEVNVFENGFLQEFKNAQANLTAYTASHPTASTLSFAPGTGAGIATPILSAAFGGTNASSYTNQTFVQYLQHGSVGSLANTLAGVSGTTPYFCNLVGASFSPCATNAGYTGSGAGYPINFFQANPFAAGYQTSYMTAAGYTNYNGLQVDLRQAPWRGLQGDLNYTWSHSLGVNTNNAYDATLGNYTTLRNLGLSYGPSIYDIQQVTHANVTYDLPFGHGRAFFSNSTLADRIIGGWNLGNILTFQTGAPFRLTGGYSTFNSQADGGTVLNGISTTELQHSVGVHRVPGKAYVLAFDPKLINAGVGANTSFLTPNTTPGTIGRQIWLHGTHQFTDDMAVTKSVPIRGELNFRLQGEFLNVFNHPYFVTPYATSTANAGVLNAGFGQATTGSTTTGSIARRIEIRANLEF